MLRYRYNSRQKVHPNRAAAFCSQFGEREINSKSSVEVLISISFTINLQQSTIPALPLLSNCLKSGSVGLR